MRPASFKWFLKKYLMQISYCGGASVAKLAREAAASNPRLRAPLFLYAFLTGNMQTLLAASSSNAELLAGYSRILELFGGDAQKLLSALEYGDNSLGAEYLKTYRSYLAERNSGEREKKLKALIRDRALALKEEKKISGYKIFKELRLNAGNVNSYLKHSDTSKVSLETARRILDFVSRY